MIVFVWHLYLQSFHDKSCISQHHVFHKGMSYFTCFGSSFCKPEMKSKMKVLFKKGNSLIRAVVSSTRHTGCSACTACRGHWCMRGSDHRHNRVIKWCALHLGQSLCRTDPLKYAGDQRASAVTKISGTLQQRASRHMWKPSGHVSLHCTCCPSKYLLLLKTEELRITLSFSSLFLSNIWVRLAF